MQNLNHKDENTERTFLKNMRKVKNSLLELKNGLIELIDK